MVNRDKTLKHALLTGAGLGESKSNENCSSGKGCVLKAALEEHLQHRKETFMRIVESAASFVDHVVALPNFPICSFQEDYEKIFTCSFSWFPYFCFLLVPCIFCCLLYLSDRNIDTGEKMFSLHHFEIFGMHAKQECI